MILVSSLSLAPSISLLLQGLKSLAQALPCKDECKLVIGVGERKKDRQGDREGHREANRHRHRVLERQGFSCEAGLAKDEL